MESLSNKLQLPHGYHLALLVSFLLASSGCWDEIHYTPSNTPTAESTRPETVEVAQVEESEAEGPTSDELFGNGTEPETPAEAPSESQPEETIVESEPVAESPLDEPELAEPPAEQSSDESMEDPFGDEEVDLPDVDDDLQSAPAELEWTEVLRPSQTALSVWKMSSRWSYAAAIYAKGLEEEYYEGALEQANYAAELLEIELPEFPTPEKEELQAAVIDYLIQAGRSQLAETLSEKYSPEYAALAELAIKSHVLLLVYTPKSQHLEPIVTAIRRAAENSTLPPSLWEELVELLEQRAPYSEVKAAVLKLHQQVGDYLGG